jgi:hypothetical protein
MSELRTVPVDVDLVLETFPEFQFSPTYVEVNRETGPAAGEAIIKGYTSVPDSIFLDADVQLLINDETVFVGEVKKAAQTETGLVKIWVYDALVNLHNKRVRLHTEEPQYATDVAMDLLSDAGYTTANDLDIFENFGNIDIPFIDTTQPIEAYVAPKNEWPGGDTLATRGYGTPSRGARLFFVLNDLAKKLGGFIWLDRLNRIRIEPYPYHRPYELAYIKEIDTGEQENEIQDVFIKGGTPVTESGQQAAALYVENRITSRSTQEEDGTDLPADISLDDPSTARRNIRTIQDDNITTQIEADSRANSEMVENITNVTKGEITVVGSFNYELYDTLTMPEIEYEYEGTSPGTFENVLSQGPFTITSISHVIDTEEGFTTTLTLTDKLGNAIGEVSGPAGLISDELVERINESEANDGPTEPQFW